MCTPCPCELDCVRKGAWVGQLQRGKRGRVGGGARRTWIKSGSRIGAESERIVILPPTVNGAMSHPALRRPSFHRSETSFSTCSKALKRVASDLMCLVLDRIPVVGEACSNIAAGGEPSEVISSEVISSEVAISAASQASSKRPFCPPCFTCSNVGEKLFADSTDEHDEICGGAAGGRPQHAA